MHPAGWAFACAACANTESAAGDSAGDRERLGRGLSPRSPGSDPGPQTRGLERRRPRGARRRPLATAALYLSGCHSCLYPLAAAVGHAGSPSVLPRDEPAPVAADCEGGAGPRPRTPKAVARRVAKGAFRGVRIVTSQRRTRAPEAPPQGGTCRWEGRCENGESRRAERPGAPVCCSGLLPAFR